MSTLTIEKPTSTPTKGRRKVSHLFNPEALEFAKATGLPVKAYCGRWMPPGRPGGITMIKLHETVPTDCKRCVAYWARHRG